MFLTALLRSLKGSFQRDQEGRFHERKTRRKPATCRRSFVPRFEILEDRTVLSTLIVTNNFDSGVGSLRDTIAAASSGDTIVFDQSLQGQTITLTSGQLAINIDLTIDGLGANQLTVSGNNSSRVFRIFSGTVTLSDLTIAHGATPGVDDGGGIANSGTLTVLACTVSLNFASLLAGGIFNDGTLTVIDCTLSGNFAAGGGGLANLGTATVSVSILSGNSSAGNGGAIFNIGTLAVADSTFSGDSTNPTGGVGGGIYNDVVFPAASVTGPGIVTVSDSTFSGNGSAEGGGIFNGIGATLTVNSSSFLANGALAGGGIFNFATATVEDSTFSNNFANGPGGGICNVGGLTVSDCTLSANSATSGAGIFNGVLVLSVGTFAGNATISDSTISGNSASTAGGGIFNDVSATVTVIDSTVCGNSAPVGADLANAGTATLIDSTVCVIFNTGTLTVTS